MPYLLWEGSNIFCAHRNLAYIFGRDVKQGYVATPRRVTCMHEPVRIRGPVHPGENNHWGALLSRWRGLDSEGPLVRVNVVAVFAPPTGDYQMPSRSEIKDRQDAEARGQVWDPSLRKSRGGTHDIICGTCGLCRRVALVSSPLAYSPRPLHTAWLRVSTPTVQ